MVLVSLEVVNIQQFVAHPFPESYPTKDVGRKLREALKQQLTIIHERVEAKKIAKLALAEVRQLLAKEEEEEKLVLGRDKIRTRVNERVATRLQEEEENMEKEEMKKALEKLRKEKAKQVDEEKSESNGEVKKAQDEDKLRGRENAKDKRKGSKAEKSARKARNEER
ncbi:PH domain-containing protein DDB_G0287875-like [Gymnodraco acuticeps]|uniref:PH domain-containing protein DDB_G0287875-like n=1 Tax=Gymnodraco acuticeps TaxID=8218 RepID=A0A6P8TV46_GYMAC|nr:PH domain-containing protein DDB_G0287875-like [Gymnodraco acuticeps]